MSLWQWIASGGGGGAGADYVWRQFVGDVYNGSCSPGTGGAGGTGGNGAAGCIIVYY